MMSADCSAVVVDPFALEVVAPGTFAARIEHRFCVGRPDMHFMFGGAGMALAARAIEQQTGEQVRLLTLQYIAPTLYGARLDIVVQRLVGDRVAQLAIVGRVAGETVLRGIAAIGSRADMPLVAVETMPAAPRPEDLPVLRAHNESEHDVHQNVEIRLARGRFGIFSKAPVSTDGHVHVWMRPTRGPVDAAILGLMGDFVPSTTSNALGVRSGGSSLDNTIRIVRIVPTHWVFCDIYITAIADGMAHGGANLFAEDGTLLAIASQSFIPRVHATRPVAGTGAAA
jgi:acyl-CoA thioesterase II